MKQTKREARRLDVRRSNHTTTAARVERWRGHIIKELAAYAERGNDIPAAWFEEIERRPMVDVLTDFVCEHRGIGVTNPNPEQQYHLDIDENYERTHTRTRNNHENYIASFAVMVHLRNDTELPIDDTMRELVRRFYRAGDCGIDAAVARAVRSALKTEVAA